jgi:hypothetical protein
MDFGSVHLAAARNEKLQTASGTVLAFNADVDTEIGGKGD